MNIQRISEVWFDWVVAASWQIALLALLVAALAWLARSASARLSHALWLLVLVKVFLPPGLITPFSLGSVAVKPAVETATFADLRERFAAEPAESVKASRGAPGRSVESWNESITPGQLLMALWCAGVVAFWLAVAWRYARVLAVICRARAVDEGAARVLLEKLGLEMGLRRMPELCATSEVTGPFLFGAMRSRIVMPESMLAELTQGELRAVLAHELAHFRRGDIWIGWFATVAQSLYWFHPLLWWAGAQLRDAREAACDEAVLALNDMPAERYSETLFRVLATSRYRALPGGALVGVFERGAKLQTRLEGIMNFHPNKQRFGWPWRLAVVVAAILLLPLSPGDIPAADEGQAGAAVPQQQNTEYPQIVKSNPKPGETGVDPTLADISITFDRDMGKGMSWTGGPPLFPTSPESKEARWVDDRTCVLPVTLEKGQFYRVGINSKNHQNFRSAAGTPVPPTAIFFTTEGANRLMEDRVEAPKVVSMSPKDGTTDVDPKTTTVLKVTFDRPMEGGMSWVGTGPQMPRLAQSKPANWSSDKKTCSLAVTLEPDHEYEIGLNSREHINFQSKWGVPLEPVVWKFRTKGAGK